MHPTGTGVELQSDCTCFVDGLKIKEKSQLNQKRKMYHTFSHDSISEGKVIFLFCIVRDSRKDGFSISFSHKIV